MNYYWPEWKVYIYGKLLFDSKYCESSKRYQLGYFGYNYKVYADTLFNLHKQKLVLLKQMQFDRTYIDEVIAIKQMQTAPMDSDFVSTEQTRNNEDKNYGLGNKKIVSKVLKNQSLTIDEILIIYENLTKKLDLDTRFLSNFSFKLDFRPLGISKLKKEFFQYLNDFTEDKLLSSGKKYESYSFQKLLFVQAFKRLKIKFGDNPTIRIQDIWGREDTIPIARFWELIFSLEKESYFNILELGILGTTQIKIGIVPLNISLPFVKIEARPKLKVAEIINNTDGTADLIEPAENIEISKKITPYLKKIGKKYVLNIKEEKIPLGNESTRRAKLIKALFSKDFFGVPKTIESLIDDIKINKDKENEELTSPITKKQAIKKIIKNTFKEINRHTPKENKFRLSYEFIDDDKIKGIIRKKETELEKVG